MGTIYSEGIYLCEIKECKLTESTNGTAGFAMKVTVKQFADGDREAVAREYDRTVYRYLTDKTIEFAAKELRALGYDRNNFDDIDQDSPNAFPFVGMTGAFYCKHETYQGEEKEKWSIASGGGSEIKPLDQSKARKLNALFGKALAAVPKKSAAESNGGSAATARPVMVPPPPSGPYEPTDEDIPF